VLRLAAVKRHHFYGRNEPFRCPAIDCNAWFAQPKDYTTHVIARQTDHHDNNYVLPEPYHSLFADSEKRIEQSLQRLIIEVERPFRKWWGEHGTEELKIAEKELIHELENDPSIVQGEVASFQEKWFARYDQEYYIPVIRDT
jgi:uncharacterized C2H2 Zn-finger protein